MQQASKGSDLLHRSLLLRSWRTIMEKSFVSHGAYVDKTYFVVELFCLISRSGLAYGLDAVLAPYMPAGVATQLVGTTPGELPAAGVRPARPAGLSAA